MPGAILRGLLVGLTLLVLQGAVVHQFPVAGVIVDLPMAIAVGGGLALGAERGAVVGFVAGLVGDLVVPTTPLGLGALTACLIGFAGGTVVGLRPRWGRWFAPAVGFVAGGVAPWMFALFGEVVGEPYLSTPHMIKISVVSGILTALLVVPARAVVAWVPAPVAPPPGAPPGPQRSTAALGSLVSSSSRSGGSGRGR